MLLVRPSVEILRIDEGALQHIEVCGRTCYKSGEKITEGSAEVFARMILKLGHESVLEHSSATVRIICDRATSHQLVRHRISSFSQESQRYVDYTKGGHVAFVIPPNCTHIMEGTSDATSQMQLPDAYPDEHTWFCAMLDAEHNYLSLRGRGWRPEQARTVLPNSARTEVIMTENLRSWRNFFGLRADNAADPQMREIAFPLLSLFQGRIPILFDNI